MSDEHRSPGQRAYEGYSAASGNRSLISGAALPTWHEQSSEVQDAWHAAAQAVVHYMSARFRVPPIQ